MYICTSKASKLRLRGPFKKKNAYVVDDRRIDVGGLEEVDDSAGRVDAREAFGGGNHEHHCIARLERRHLRVRLVSCMDPLLTLYKASLNPL